MIAVKAIMDIKYVLSKLFLWKLMMPFLSAVFAAFKIRTLGTWNPQR